jgi:hypothetical protein
VVARILDWLNGGEDPRGELIQQIHGLIQQLNLEDLKNAYWIYAVLLPAYQHEQEG